MLIPKQSRSWFLNLTPEEQVAVLIVDHCDPAFLSSSRGLPPRDVIITVQTPLDSNQMRRSVLLILTMLAISVSQSKEVQWPDAAPDDWLLAFVDVETTGLVPGYHEMIDIGIVMTDLEGVELGELFVRIQPDYPERTDEGARAVNAFDEDRWRELGALPALLAVDRIVSFHNDIAGDKTVLMVALNSHFDAAFLDHLFRSRERSWRELYHYFVLDLPSMAWSLGLRSLTGSSLSETLGVEDEPHVADLHTGITGAKVNARIYRAVLAYAKSTSEK